MKGQAGRLFSQILLGGVLLVVGCASEPVHIHGQIDNLPDGDLYLYRLTDSLERVDSTRSSNGTFQFDMPNVVPDMLYVQFTQYGNDFLPVIIEGREHGEVSISGNFHYGDAIEMGGTPANMALNSYRHAVRRYDIMLKAINMSLGDSEEIEELEALVKKRDSITLLRNDLRLKYVKENESDIFSAYLIANMPSDSASIIKRDTMLNYFNWEQPDNVFMNTLRKYRPTNK